MLSFTKFIHKIMLSFIAAQTTMAKASNDSLWLLNMAKLFWCYDCKNRKNTECNSIPILSISFKSFVSLERAVVVRSSRTSLFSGTLAGILTINRSKKDLYL